MSPEEGALVQRAKELDPQTWAHIYQLFYPKIYRYLRYRLGSQEVAEDLAATVFEEALERIGSFKYRGVPLLAWLYRIAHNLAVSHLRRVKAALVEPLTEAIPSPSPSPEEATQRAASRHQVNTALEGLTEEQRQVILLKFVSGLTNAEIAQVMNKPEGAIKSLQHRALVSLRRLLGGEDIP